MITLGNAAKTLHVSKGALSKAISRGHLSATKREDGSFSIDPSELSRWWEGARHRFRVDAAAGSQSTTHGVNGGDTAVAVAAVDVVEIRRVAGIEAENKALREMAAELRADRELWRDQAAHWRSQAERLLLSASLVTPPPPVPAPASQRRASWWRWWERQAS